MQAGLAVIRRIHAEDASSALVHIPHHVSCVLLRNCNIELHNRLQQTRLSFYDPLLECERSGNLERHLVGVYIMIRAVVQNRLDIDNLAACKRPLLHGLQQTLLNSRNIALRDCSSKQLFGELKIFRGWRESDMHISILPGST